MRLIRIYETRDEIGNTHAEVCRVTFDVDGEVYFARLGAASSFWRTTAICEAVKNARIAR
jgi:hypothetical protein